MLRVLLEYVKDREVLSYQNSLGKTPLVLVAESTNTDENERMARMLLAAGVDPKAG